jgi:hypothetical protein
MTSSKGTNGNRNNAGFSQRIPQNIRMNDDFYDDTDDNQLDDDNQYGQNDYFSNPMVMDEKMVRYQKREMPPLQRYGGNSQQRDIYSSNGNSRTFNQQYMNQQYLPNQDDEYQSESKYYKRQQDGRSHFRSVWNKFIITFTSALSLVCLSWIAYNWSNGGDSRSPREAAVARPIVIGPDSPSFKILPDNPGGVDIPYQDKMVYENMDNANDSFGEADGDENILPMPEEPVVRPRQDSYMPTPKDSSSLVMKRSANSDNADTSIDEYSIIDEKTYYIKMASGPNKQILLNEIKNIKSKYSDKISGLSCSVKSVKDKNGNKKHALLIGPFDSKDIAISMAKKLNTDCAVVAVKE